MNINMLSGQSIFEIHHQNNTFAFFILYAARQQFGLSGDRLHIVVPFHVTFRESIHSAGQTFARKMRERERELGD